MSLEELEAEVLNVPAGARARLAERLLASFEPRSSAHAAWLELARRRREDAEQGRVELVRGDEALARVRARIA